MGRFTVTRTGRDGDPVSSSRFSVTRKSTSKKEDDKKKEKKSSASFLSSLPAYQRAYSAYTAPKTSTQTFSLPSSSKTATTSQNIGTGALKAELADRRASGDFTMPGSHEGRVKELEAHSDTVRKQLQAQFQPLDYKGTQIGKRDVTAAQLLNSSLSALAQEAAQESFLADLDRLSTRTTGRPGNISVEDFLSKSRYVPTGNGDAKFRNGLYTSTGFDDILYDYINRNPKAVEIKNHNATQLGHTALGFDSGYLSQMGDTEIGIFNYIYSTQGPDAAYDYIDEIKNSLTARNRAEEEAMWRSMARESPSDTAGMSVFSVLTSTAKGLSYIGQLADYAADGTIDQNAGTNRLSYINSAIRSEASDIVETNWGAPGSFLYNTGMSMADFLYTTAISGGFGAAPGTAAAKASSGLARAIMGTGAAADTVIASKDRGLSDDQAFALGTIAGLAEIATEKYSLDALLKDPKNAVLFVLQNAGVEASEETASSLINFIADRMISGNDSEWNVAINNYISQGYSEKEAKENAFWDQFKSIALDALGGALSGGVLSGARVGANAIYNRASGAQAVDAGSPIIQNQNATDTEAQQQTQTDPLQALAEEMAAKEAEEIFPTVEERPLPKPQESSVVSEQQQQETAPEPSWKKYTGAPRADGTNPAAQARAAARQAAENADLASMDTTERESFLQAYDMGRSGESFEADVSSLPVQSDAVYGAFFQGQDDYFNGNADRYQAYRTRETGAEQATQVETPIQESRQISQEEAEQAPSESMPVETPVSEQTAPETTPKKEGIQIPIEERTWQDAGNRKVNAFQYDNPELRPYFAEAAKALQYDLASAVKGERMPVYDASSETGKDVIGVTGTKRSVTDPIAQALDNAGLSYAQIEKALSDLIADNGQENYAAAKKVELVLDDMLANGYTDSDGQDVPPNQEYISAREEASKQDSTEYKMSEEEWDSILSYEPSQAEKPSTEPSEVKPSEKPAEKISEPSTKKASKSEKKPKEKIKKTKPENRDTKSQSAQQEIADYVRKYIENGTQFSPAKLFEIADKAYGGTMAEGSYTVKDAYDGMELAVNQYLMNGPAKNANGDVKTAKKFLSEMDQLLSNLPTQTKRTEEMESYQQFSTPPNIAYLAAWTANVSSSDVVLEPSAGIGGLALWPKAWGATVYANELSTRRLEFLKQLGLDCTFNLNAEQIDNLLPDSIKPSVVIMNPPFSSTAGRTSTNKTANAKRHIEQALERLESGGRLVAILGRGMSDNAPSFRSWWRDIKKEYNVRANIQIDGSNYKKYGTTFDVQMVVIDKSGPTTGETLTGTYKDLSQVLELMERIRNDRQGTVRSGDVVDERTPSAVSVTGSVETSGRAARPSPDAVPGRKQRGGSGARTSDRSGAGKRGTVRAEPDGNIETVQSGTERQDEKRLDKSDGGARMALSRSAGANLDGRTSPDVLTEENIDSTYSAYSPQKVHIKGAKRHPAKLVESAAMAAVEPPDPTYTPALPERIAKEGILSDAQLENVVYAGQAHSQKLADGRRKGFFIGDGTGVGKGRQIAGIIMDNFIQGRKKAVWISEKASLLEDAKRDWKDLGGNPDDVIDMKNPKLLKTGIQAESGIVFAPYTTLRSQKEARLKMLQDWLGNDFDGVIALDEAHNMGNSVVIKKGRGKTKPAAQAIAGIELQKAFPNARVVYASATGATDISQYGYLDRLGLWGKGTAFNDLNDFIEKISNGGLAAMELVARDMKSMGVYMARSISYDDVRYDTIQHDLTPMQTEIYNTMSKAWQKVLQNVDEALRITGANNNGQARGAAYSAIFSGQQRFYNQILTSMSMPSVIADIKKELAAGRSVVLQLTNTNEAQATRAIAKNEAEGGNLDDIDLTPSESLKDLLQKSFPVNVYEEYTDEDGRTKSRMVTDSEGNPVIDKKAVRMRDQLIAELSQMKVPDGPLEMLFDAFGPDQVAEVTGRTQRVVEKEGQDGVKRRVLEKRGPTSGLADTKMFQDGKKRILVFSEAGGTGKSYHADLRAKNQQQRVHYLLQAGWNASKAVQGFGRTHRSNQASAPIFRLVTTNVMGQKRFTSTIARRLDQLGALTKGQRQAGSGVFSERDNLENPIAMDALSQYYKSVDPDVLKKLGLYDKIYDENGRINESSEDLRNVSRFLNRILSLEVESQNEVFQGFYDTFERMLDNAIANGTVDMGLENYRADRIDVVDENVIRTDPSGADTKYVQMVAYKKPEIVTYDQIEDLFPNFKKLVRMEGGEMAAVYEISSKTNEKGEVERRYRLQRPQLSKRSTYVESTMKSKTTDIPKKEWKSAWESELKKVPEYEENTIHMLTGTLLPIWNRLPPSNTRVMRVVTADGRQYLGRVIPPSQIDGVLRGFGSNRTKKTYTSDQITSAVMEDGKEVILQDNKMKIVRRRVSGEWRMEITGQNLWYLPRQVKGVISEKIGSQFRYFIPTGDNGKPVLEDIVKINPVVDVRASVRADDVDSMIDTSKATGDREEQWTSERVGSQDKEPMSLSDIIRKIEYEFGINVTIGHIRGSTTRGRYNRADKGIRIKTANDLPTVAHEVGHYFDDIYSLTKRLNNSLRKELVDNLEADMKKAYPERKWVKEGVAEFMRRFLQNRETAAIDYPMFTEYFLSSLNNTDGPLIEQLADEVNAYYSLDADTATSSIRFSYEGGADFRSIPEKIRDAGDVFYQAWVDSNHAIKRFSDETGNQKAYILASNAAYADAVAGEIVTGDLTDANGQYVAPGLKSALSGINTKDKKEWRLFGEYLVVKHGPERLKEGLRVFADDWKNSTRLMERRQAELESQFPEFKAASERLYAFEQNFLQTWGVSSGLVSHESAAKWQDRWEFYVPFNRAFKKGGRYSSAKRGFANQSSGIKKSIGSGLDIVHPVENIIYNVVRMVNASKRNMVMLQIVNQANKSGGMAHLLEKVPMPLERISYDAKELKKNLMKGVEESDMSSAEKDAAFDIVENIDDILYQFRRGKAGGDVVAVMRNGKPEYWKINDAALLDSISNIAPAKLPAVLEIYGSVSRFMTSNITGNNVIWSIFSNAPRDLMTFFTYSKNKNPFKLLGGIGSTYLNQIKGQNADPLYKEYLAMGGGKSSVYTADRSLAKKAIKSFNRSVLDYLNPMEWISFVSDSVEMGPRFSYYKILRERGLSPQKAFYESSDITVNFRRAGSSSRVINRFIPFFNASVQGVDKFSRWITAQDAPIKSRKKAAAARASMYVASSLAIAALIYALNNKDDDDKKNYQQLSNYTKNTYWCIPIGDGKFFAIPKPRELAALSSFFETSMEYFHGGNKHAFDEFYDYVSENFLPNVLSDFAKLDVYGAIGSLGIIGVGSYMMANRDFMGRPIVSNGLQSLEPKDQYTERTSKIAKVLGDAFNQSPQMIDYFFQQTLGGWWKAQKALFPVGDAEIDPTIGIRNTYIKDSQYSTDLVNWLYDTSESSTAAKNSAPDDTEKAITAKWDSNMQEFYSRYYAVSKNSPETDLNRSIRQEVLDMIADYRNLRESGDKTSAQKTAESIAKKANDTGLLPSVMQNSVKDANDKVHTLSGPQYVEFQTDYLRIYWEAVEGAVSKVDSQNEKKLVLEKAKSVALDEAKIRALKRIGAPYQEEKEEDEGGNEDESIYSVGLTPSEAVLYEIAYDMAESELNENGNTIPGSKQEKVIEAIENINGLTDEQKSWLFRSKYPTSYKNNPWA